MDPSQLQSALTAATSHVPAEPSSGGDSSSSTSTSFTSVSSVSCSSISFTSVSSSSLSSFTSVSSTSCNKVSPTSCHAHTSCCQSTRACSSTVTTSADSNIVLSALVSSPPACATSSPATYDLCSAATGGTGSHTAQFTSPATSSQTSKSDRSSRGPMCRICHEGEGVSELISPCWCTGSVGAVHKACLERWLTLASCDKCELCGYIFPVTRSPKPFWKFLLRCDNPGIRRALLVDGVCLLVLTPLAVASIYLCIMGAFYYTSEDHDSSDTFISQLLILAKQRRRRTKIPTQAERVDAPGIEESTETPRRRRHKRLEESVEKDLPWEALGLVLLALLLLALYLAWAVMVLRYQARVWRRWRVVHQDLMLVDTGRRPSRLCLTTTICHNLRSSFSLVSLQSFGDLPGQHSGSADTLLAGAAGEDAISLSGGVLDCGSSQEEHARLQFVNQESASREARMLARTGGMPTD